MTLYEIDQAILSLVDQETGELLDYEKFQQLQMDRDRKIENTALWIKNLTAEAKAIKEEVDSLQKRRKAAENRAEGLKRYLSEALDGEKFQTPRCSISYRKSTALEVDNAISAAEWLKSNGYNDLVIYSDPTLDKRSVTDLVKHGENIPGVSLVERQNMTVR